MVKKILDVLMYIGKALLFSVPLYIIIKFFYYRFIGYVGGNLLINGSLDAGEHVDFTGITIGITIALLIDKQTRYKLSILSSANEKIQSSTEELKSETKQLIEKTTNSIDSARRIIDNIPSIFKSVEEILDSACNRNNQLRKFYYMNGPVSFGKLHSYNKRILEEICKTDQFINYAKSENKPLSEEEKWNLEIFICNQKANRIASKLKEICRRIAEENEKIIKENSTGRRSESKELIDLKIVVSCEKELKKFFKDYLNTEKNVEGIIDYTITASDATGSLYENVVDQPNNHFNEVVVKKIEADLENKQKIEEDINCKFLNFNQIILDYWINRQVNNNNIRYSDKDPQYQLYLVDCTDVKYSLLIFYHDENLYKEGKTTSIRRMVGFSSDNRHIFKGLEDIYNDKFDKLGEDPIPYKETKPAT